MPSDIANARFVGQPINVNYNYKFVGIWQTADSALARSFGAKPGDIRVADIAEAEPKVLALGARRLPGEGGDFRVYADPVGHPFCLVWDA